LTNTRIEISSAFAYSYQIPSPRQTINYQDNQNITGYEELAVAENPQTKTMAGKIINGFFGKFKKQSNTKNSNEQLPDQRNFSFWDIAEFGVKSVNAIGDHNYTLVREYNNNGKVKGVIILDE
jgi:hypothetical protein